MPVEPACPYVGRCGGCRLQHLEYSEQLEQKTGALYAALGPVAPGVRLEVIGAPDPWHYRNRAELTFSRGEGDLALGFHAAGSFWRIVDIDACLLLPEPLNPLLRTLRLAARATGQPAYDSRAHLGFFRYAMLRHSRATGETMVCVITAPGDGAAVEQVADAVCGEHPNVSGVWWGTTANAADVAYPQELRLLRGSSLFTERIGEFTLRLQPFNFVQPNLAAAEPLYSTVMEWLMPGATGGAAWDCYCGVGVVALYLARRFGRVYGIDSEPGNVEAARLNAEANGIRNAAFYAGRTQTLFADKRFWLLEAHPEAIVVDPPRAGLHEQVISTLLAARPRQIVYISCNPQALVRDLAVLLRGYPRYQVRRAAAVDLFPQTPHLETVVLLER